MTVQNDSIEFRRDSLPIFADHSVAFGRTGTRFSDYEHFYLFMNNSGLVSRMGEKADDYCFFPNQANLKSWSTSYCLSEVVPFFRLPVLFDGETIEIPKETAPVHISDGIYLGLDMNGFPVNFSLNDMPRHAFFTGMPGSGKTMLARRLPSILPELSFNEALEITKIYSIVGLTSKENPLILKRPFRSPHHTITSVSLVGGGKNPKPGEISLAHYGVLFLDELPEFNKNTLEVLRGPLEDRKVTISRLNASITYPCNFMLVASMNPCPCGYYGSKDKECCCKPDQIKKYRNKISGPLLDRIDLHIEVNGVKYKKLQSTKKEEDSETIRKRVNKARKIQIIRYKKYNIYSNSELTPQLIEKFCKLNAECKKILEISFERLGLSARAYSRILKVARTIADLDESKDIQQKHLAEAIQYRSLDRKYWDYVRKNHEII